VAVSGQTLAHMKAPHDTLGLSGTKNDRISKEVALIKNAFQ
jgi:hypothetical protein